MSQMFMPRNGAAVVLSSMCCLICNAFNRVRLCRLFIIESILQDRYKGHWIKPTQQIISAEGFFMLTVTGRTLLFTF